jgi:hypothetical protein
MALRASAFAAGIATIDFEVHHAHALVFQLMAHEYYRDV